MESAKRNDLQSKRESQTQVFRDPIHGLISIYPWELALIDTEEFQRLRRIHQLSMTYLIYHGAEHTRFGHSIGVLHIAGQIMDHLRHFAPLKDLDEDEFFEKKALVRTAALLHDIGHGCFSHIGENDANIYPNLKDPVSGEPASGHEVYTRCIIKERLAGCIESRWPREMGYTMVEDVLMILSQGTSDPTFRFFDDIISGQLDCDKMDYLLRDSHYCGVEYGVYDLDKLVHSLRVAQIEGNNVLAVSESGIQAVEGFVLARYWMFIQVYFHKDRRLFDYYLSSFLREYLLISERKTGAYPTDLSEYLTLDDNKIQCAIRKYAVETPARDTERICCFARRLYKRDHHRVVFNPPYVHYKGKDEEQAEAYSRISYVHGNIMKFLSKPENGWNAENVYVDLAKGSSAKHLFDIKIYDEESDPDCKPDHTSPKEIPAIPVISKHGGSVRPIQDYSFTLRSISDREISILRVYADEAIADDVQRQCSAWFDTEYTNTIQRLKKEQQDIAELMAQLAAKQANVDALKGVLEGSVEPPPAGG